MWETIWNIIQEFGLFVGLVAYVIWDARQRELRMRETMKELKQDNKEIIERLYMMAQSHTVVEKRDADGNIIRY